MKRITFLSWQMVLFAWPQNGIASGVSTNDDIFFGQSPPVYPSPEIDALGARKDAVSKAKHLVSQMTLEEKVNLTAGIQPTNGCAGVIAPIERIGFPGLCLHDAGHGVHHTDFVSSWPSNIHVGASWNRKLARERAEALGGEFKRKGVNVMLGPSIGPLGRVVTGGRNWEGFSIDPYLSGELVYETVLGVEHNGVTTCTKHFIGNEQELYRNPSTLSAAVSSNIDDATMHGIYLWPFYNAVRAGTGSVMCSYQRLNNSYACQNSKILNGLLKKELGFQGFVVTDWGALHAGYDAAAAGLDMVMPLPGKFWGVELIQSVRNGSLSEERLDDMATRILATWYQSKQDEQIPEPGHGLPYNLALPHKIVDARKPSDKHILFQSAAEGHVLVKNTNNTLPLIKPKLLSVLGYSATSPPTNMVGTGMPVAWNVGFQATFGSGFLQAVMDLEKGIQRPIPAIAANGTIISGAGSGATSQTNFFAPFDALKIRADEDDTQLFWDFVNVDPEVVGVSDACLVFGNAFATEAIDRPGLTDNYTDTLILNVARKCPRTIVILHNAGIRLADPWIDHPNITAVIYAHLAGQEVGRALVSLLYGDINFSGKLPYTVAKNETDYRALLYPEKIQLGQFEKFPQSNFSEGVYVDYRHFDRYGIEPRFEFGFGLSYTSFNYSGLQIRKSAGNGSSEFPVGPVSEGGRVDLWDDVAVVSVGVANTGTVEGAEVAQLYVGIPGAPVKQLRGFEKSNIKAGCNTTFDFHLNRRDLSIWNVEMQSWQLQRGLYNISVGASSRLLHLTGRLEI